VPDANGGVRRFPSPSGRRTKWWTVLLWLVIAAAAVPLAGSLEDLGGNSAAVEMPRDASATRVAELADRFPDGQVSEAIVVYVRDAGLTAADRGKVEADRARFTAAATAPVDPVAVSKDGRAAILIVPLDSDQSTLADDARAVRDGADEGLPAGLTAKVTGPAGAALDASDARERTDKLVTLVTLGVVILLLLMVYRSPVLWILPLINIGIALMLTRAVQYLLGEYAGLTVNPENAAVVTVLVFGVGTDYALLLLSRYREELHRHADRHTAMRVALRGGFPALVASAGTVALGLLCLLAADMGFNHTLGTAGAIAVVCALVCTVTVFPALLVIFGRWVFWPLIPRVTADHGPSTRGWSAIGRGVARRPRIVWVLSLLLLGGLAAGMSGMRIGLADDEVISGHPASVAGQELLAAHFPAGRSKPVHVVADVGAESAVHTALQSVPGVVQVGAAVRSTDGTLVRFDAVLATPSDSAESKATVARIHDAVDDLPGADADVGGATAELVERDAAQEHDRDVVIPLVLVVVFILLLVLLRTLVGAVILMITVVASYAAALGAAWLLFDHVLGFPAVDVQLPLVGFLFVVALGADYNIFLLSRVREEVALHGYREGLQRALGATGGVITSAGLVLAATFAALNLAPQVAFKQIGLLVALAVLLDAMFVRLILVPALASDLGRWFWWPSDPGRRTEPDPQPPTSPAPLEKESIPR
jgi:RND superfamily putative drug exporter